MNRPLVVITLIYITIIIAVHQLTGAFGGGSKKEFSRYVTLAGTVDSEPVFGEKTISFVLKAKYLIKNKKQVPFGKKIVVFLLDKGAKVSYGDLVRLKGIISSAKEPSNPDQFDYGGFLERSGVAGQLSVFDPSENNFKVMAKDKGNIFISQSLKLKDRLIAAHKKNMPEPYASVFGSVIFGLKASPVSDEIKSDFQRSGVMHILVASGQQVSILIGVTMAAGRLIGLSEGFTAVITSLIIWSFTAMAGFGSSILRAAIMGQVVIAAPILGRESDFYSSFALSALILLVINPFNLFDIGFQLSFLATWSLVYAAPVIESELSKHMHKLLSSSLSVAAAPVLVTIPISVFYFSQMTFIAFISNILVVPLAEALTTIGFISTAVSAFFEPAAAAVDGINYILTKLLCVLARSFASVPSACAYVRQPHIILVLIYYCFVVYLIEEIRKERLIKMIGKFKHTAAVLLLLGFLLFSISPVVLAKQDLKVTVLDVGQGDSIFIKMPDGENILIDGGTGKAGKNIVLPFLQKQGVNMLDYAVLTHPHEDHLGGLLNIIGKVKVNTIMDSGYGETSGFYYSFLQLVQSNKIKYLKGRAGQIYRFGGATLEVLAPFNTEITGTISDPNNNSIVMRLLYGNTSFLFAGDAAFEEENEILSRFKNIKSGILKIGHHGSATSSSYDFIKAVSPGTAMISVGLNNRYNLPSKRTVMLLEKLGINIVRTDMRGAIILTSDGRSVKVTTIK
ncbi:MAG: DNA internalization-related competence protein ComEC/Rec2 [Candidatus Saganbacteria bacterium]|nr:DNA internalization-related competence protein ComEC/Rec2 [Candidatus Saganbacteria bacterium]